jgi:hypothetical protein
MYYENGLSPKDVDRAKTFDAAPIRGERAVGVSAKRGSRMAV